jgi:hypothetical protein
MNTAEEYECILRECIFVSKPDEWFLEGLQAELDILYSPYEEGKKFNDNSAIMEGLTNEGFIGYVGEFPRRDSEGCPLSEFEIYDKYGNEISELTLSEYRILLRGVKLDLIL